MNPIPPIGDNPHGLHARYHVTKTNGEPTDPRAIYFVLRLDEHGRDLAHILACRAAARCYADVILRNSRAEHLHQMARELDALVAAEANKI